jgi:hypothetical protein
LTWTSAQIRRSDLMDVADDQHPDHEFGVDRGPAGMAVVGLKLLVDPPKIEHGVDLAREMIRRHHPIQIEFVEQLALASLPPPHHGPTPPLTPHPRRNHGSVVDSIRVLQHALLQS